MSRPRNKTVPGYRTQAMLPLRIGWFDGVCEDAEFTEYDGKPCVEALVQLGLLRTPYTLVLSYEQALEADIIERVPDGN